MQGRALTAVKLELLAGIACLWRRHHPLARPSLARTTESILQLAIELRPASGHRRDPTMGLCGRPGPASITSPASLVSLWPTEIAAPVVAPRPSPCWGGIPFFENDGNV